MKDRLFMDQALRVLMFAMILDGRTD
jgi:hypothetical protein